MKTLYFECNMGAAGDMLMSALLELIPNPDGFIEKLNNIGIPNVRIEKQSVTKCGIIGTGVNILVHGHEENEHMHDCHRNEDNATCHSHEHHEHHHHTRMNEISDIIQSLKVSDKVKCDIKSVYNLIAEAESQAHGRPVEQIHFHEVGTMDAVADIAGVCMLIDEIKPDQIISSPIHVGSGQVRCAHGILPVPAPATARILHGIPSYGGAVNGELCTPTGAALLRHFAAEFVKSNTMITEKIGYGMGKKHFYDERGTEILSAVRAMIGESEDKTDHITMLSCNIDDMTGEQMGFAVKQILSGGALDVFTIPIYMKKNRPGMLLTVICTERDKAKFVQLIFKHTTTIGVRELSAERYILSRSNEIKHSNYGDVTVKKATGYGVSKEKPEFEELKDIAVQKNIALSDIRID